MIFALTFSSDRAASVAERSPKDGGLRPLPSIRTIVLSLVSMLQNQPGNVSVAGHFAGIQFFRDQIDSTHWPYRLPGPVSNLAAEMAGIESVPATRANALE